MKNSKDKQIKMIILILQLILYVLVSSGAICVIVVKKLSFIAGAQIFLPIVIGTIGGIIINIVGKKN